MIEFYFEHAIKEAHKAFYKNLVPVGAVLVYDAQIISQKHNEIGPLDHAEILVLNEGIQKLGYQIKDAILYVTLEPCAMCLAALSLCGVKHVYFGAYNEKSVLSSSIELYGGFYEKECGVLLKDFFVMKR